MKTFKQYFTEATVIDTSPYSEPAPLKDNDTIRVYHAFNRVDDLLNILKYGGSGKERAKRIYSYESNNNPNGFFVTIDLNIAKAFGQNIMEFHTKVSDLESPVWPGSTYTVQGGYAEYFKDSENREEQRLKERENSKKSEHDYVRDSDRPELAEMLYNSREHQALFVGDLNKNSIRAIWVNANQKTDGRFSTWDRYSIKEFLNKYKEHDTAKSDNDSKIFSPREEFNIDIFIQRLIDEYPTISLTREKVINSIKRMSKHEELGFYLWPKQLEVAFKEIQEL